MTKTIATKNGQIEESLEKVIVPRLKRNIAEMQKITEQATTQIRIAIGRDLIKARAIVFKRGQKWGDFLKKNFAWSDGSARHYIIAAETNAKLPSAKHFTTLAEHLRVNNPTYGMPRQKVDEQPIRNILAGIDADILLERERSEKKEGRLKKLVAFELVEAGFRALSHKVHADKGGSDDAMMRLDEVRKALKGAISRNEISF